MTGIPRRPDILFRGGQAEGQVGRQSLRPTRDCHVGDREMIKQKR